MSSVHPTDSWSDPRTMRVLGMGAALPGPPVSTAELLEHIERRFDVCVSQRGQKFAHRLKIETRHICRDFTVRHEAPRLGHSNPELAGTALQNAFAEAHLQINDLAYIIGHTTSPARLVPSQYLSRG